VSDHPDCDCGHPWADPDDIDHAPRCPLAMTEAPESAPMDAPPYVCPDCSGPSFMRADGSGFYCLSCQWVKNPVLADALRYYEERRSMANPKGWEHVLRKVEQGVAAGLWPTATEADIAEARAALATPQCAEEATP
jgi:hypothetical protein